MKISNITFRLMAHLGMPIRNLFMPPKQMLAEVELKPGQHVLDFGCGPGTFSIMAADRVGPLGVVYALDIHPLAVKITADKAHTKKFINVKTILTDCATALADHSIDRIIFFDVCHEIDNRDEVLKELYRVLKPEEIMYFSDHHMQESHITSALTDKGLFKLMKKGKRVFSFQKM